MVQNDGEQWGEGSMCARAGSRSEYVCGFIFLFYWHVGLLSFEYIGMYVHT